MTETRQELVAYKQELELKRLELKNELAEAKADYVIEGIELPWAQKVEWEAELSYIALQVARINKKIRDMAQSYHAGKVERWNIHMRRLLNERGLQALVERVDKEVSNDLPIL